MPRERVPWWAKIAAKLVLSRLPVSYGLWRGMRLFRHGAMDEPGYALAVFRQHFDRVRPAKGFVGMEIGPGDSLFSSLVASGFGSSRFYLVDAGRFAVDDVAPYRAMAAHLSDQGFSIPDVTSCRSLDDLLMACNASYLTEGLRSLRTLADQSVDFVLSHAALEHVRKTEFLDLQREIYRVLRPGGGCSHRVDLTDHLEGSLNHLRFPERIWEGRFFSRSGFYTNRLRLTEMSRLFAEAGFAVEVLGEERWPTPPIASQRLAFPFRDMAPDELRVSGFDVVLRRG